MRITLQIVLPVLLALELDHESVAEAALSDALETVSVLGMKGL